MLLCSFSPWAVSATLPAQKKTKQNQTPTTTKSQPPPPPPRQQNTKNKTQKTNPNLNAITSDKMQVINRPCLRRYHSSSPPPLANNVNCQKRLDSMSLLYCRQHLCMWLASVSHRGRSELISWHTKCCKNKLSQSRNDVFHRKIETKKYKVNHAFKMCESSPKPISNKTKNVY